MKTFTGSEISFNHTYFSAKPDRIVEIKTDSPVHPLSLTEVPETAGSYSFIDDGLGFYNRTLFWRTESSRIHFNEICATQEVPDSSLCIDFHPSVIIAGTTVNFHRGVLIIAIPTPSAIYRLLVCLGNLSEVNGGNQSVLSFFPNNENYASYYDYHFLPNGTTISRSSIAHDFYGNTVCVAVNNRNQLVLIEMPMRQSKPVAHKETILGEGSVLGRLFKRNLDPTLGLTLANFGSDLFVISAQSDGRIRIWSAADGTFKGVYVMSEHLRSDLKFDVDDMIIKAGMCFGQRIIVIKFQLVRKAKFFILSYDKEELNLITNCDLYATCVVDFLFVESLAEKQEITLWAASRESYEENNSDSMFQPYLLRHCALELNGTTESEWKTADPAVPNAVLDKLVFENLTVESVKQRIFDGDTYSFEIVQRAVQTICKCPTIVIQYRDWHALSCFTEEFVQSGQFIQMYLSEQDQNTIMLSNMVDQSLLESAYERFWLDVQKCCNQFQETLLNPIAIWHSPTLGLVGTIQSCRFTVYVDPDSRLQSLVLSQGNAIDIFFEIIKNYVMSNFQLKSTDCDHQMACKVKADTLCRIVRWFGEQEDDLDLNLVPMKSAYLESSFSTTLLATALRQRVLSRLCFAKVISTIIKLLPEIFMLADKNFDQRSMPTISTQLSSIFATVKHYNTLWFTLSTTYLKRTQNSGNAPKLVTIAQSFFKSGLPFSHDRSNFIDEDMDEMQTDDGSSQQQRKSLTDFSRFLWDALNDAMITLWPESKSMTFSRFLAENKYYDALKEYCEKSHPYISELSAAFYFFQGIACSGMGQPDLAATYFEEASQGIVAESEVLNGVLSTYTNKPYSHKHTLTDFYYVVMNVFKDQLQTEYVIRAGMFALKFVEASDPILPTVYALMFNQYVQTEQYFEAIRVLHMNTSKESQESCLRSLVTTLWDVKRTKSLVDLHYADLTDRVAELLEAKSHLMPLSSDDGFFEVVYAFYMHRYNYEAAARIMYLLCWRLRWVPQSREVLERRLRVLSCVCQTVEMLPENFSISFDLDMQELMKSNGTGELTDENTGGKVDAVNKRVSLKNVGKKSLYDEYLMLEARLTLLNSGDFPNGPPVGVNDIYDEAISHRLYDTAFVVQRRFHLDTSRLFNALALDCVAIGFDEKSIIPNWVFSNCRFVDYVNKEEDHLRPHWKLLVAYLDLTLKVEPADVLPIQKVAEMFLERSLEIPKWLETRYLKVNSRYFYHQLIEFDELEYALKVLLVQLNQCAAQKIRPQDIHTIPVAHIDLLYKLALENAGQKPELFEMAEQSKGLLSKILRSMKMLSGHSAMVR